MTAVKKAAAKKPKSTLQTPAVKKPATRRTAAKPAASAVSPPVAAPRRPAAARPELQLSLQFADARHRDQLPRHRVIRWLRAALDRPAEFTVRVVDEDEGRALNAQFRGKDYATNVLTFDYAQSPVAVADLVLCAPVLEREARTLGLSVADHGAHLLVHGALHAQGWDHETSQADAEAMEALETRILLGLGLHDPYTTR